MAGESANIFEEYARYLVARAAAAVLRSTAAGVVVGAAVGAVPQFLHHTVVAGSSGYLLVALAALVGGIAGRSLGERRAVGIRLQAKLVLHQGLSHAVPPAPAPQPSEILAPAVASPPPPVAAEPPIVAPAALPVTLLRPTEAAPPLPVR